MAVRILIKIYTYALILILGFGSYVGYFFAFLGLGGGNSSNFWVGSAEIAGLATIALIFARLVGKPEPSPPMMAAATFFTIGMAVFLHH